MFINFNPSGRPQSLVTRIVGAVIAALAFGAALMGAAVLFVGVAVAALAFWGYFWWKTRALRRPMREQGPSQGFGSGHASGRVNIIEGEAVRVDEDRERLEKTVE